MSPPPFEEGRRPVFPSKNSTPPEAAPRRDVGGFQDDKDTFKTYRQGTHRTRSPEVTLRELQPLLPVAGITRVSNVTGLDVVGLPVIQVCRPNARSLSVSQGKGLTLVDAKVSGIMECLELYHAERIQRPLERASWREISLRHALIDLSGLEPAHSSQWHPDRRSLWIASRELLSGEPIWLPFEAVHMDCTVPLPDGSGCFQMSSNGLASGNHPLEALSHGLCEVIERDAIARWHRLTEAQKAATRVHLESVDDPSCRAVLDRFQQADLTVVIWDATSAIGLPAFHCEVGPRHPETWHGLGVCNGHGCHLHPGIALLRALTEAAQSRVTWIAGSRDDLDGRDLQLARQPDRLETWCRRAEVERPGVGEGVDFARHPDLSSPTFDDDVDGILQRLRAAGFEQVVAVDLTQPGFGIPVVRVIVPHLLNHH